MHQELQEFFNMHAAHTATHKRAIHDQAPAILDMAHDVESHVRELQAKLRRAMVAPHDHAIDTKLTYLKTRLAGADSSVKMLLASLEAVMAAVVEIEDAFTPATRDIAELLAPKSVEPASDEA
jgi:hypothetical protein